MKIFGKARGGVSADAVQDAICMAAALDKVQGIIWFGLDGRILDANDKFLALMGYELSDIVGQHHSMFMPGQQAEGQAYKQFWAKLSTGEFHAGEFERKDRNGNVVWIEASYNPIFDKDGNPVKVVKFAIDVTEEKTRLADADGQLHAISRSQAVIEFDLEGKIITANENFCDALGYALSDIVGKHHRIFVPEEDTDTPEYAEFWRLLGSGRFHSGEFRRVAKDGRDIWIQATYNPILDPAGRPVKIVKFASDITETKMITSDAAGQLAAISKSQAVIEFDMNGHVLKANDNFLNAFGFDLEEVVGRHHRMFVDPADAKSDAYRAFWDDLRAGLFVSAECRRVDKAGSEVWIQASYNPILGPDGKPYKIVKYATELTDRKRAMDAFSRGLIALSEGDLSARLPDTLVGDFAVLQTAFNTTMARLEQLVTSILAAAEQIAEETGAIANSASDLSARSENQAASLEESAAAMTQLSQSVQSTSDSARIASEAARDTSQQAEDGGTVVAEAIAAMQRIEERTGEIGQIVEMIDGISFQTNLLALNAGVEAARAGEAGRGFAVVASEVRALAQRSSESAREINELITASNSEVADGVRLVNQSGDVLGRIVKGVRDAVSAIGDITRTSEDQAMGITEVTSAVADIDRNTQSTAALSGDSSTSAKQLAQRARELRELVSFFRLDRKQNPYPAGSASSNPTAFEPGSPQSQTPTAKAG